MFNQAIMEGALRNLIDWSMMSFMRSSEKGSLLSRELTSRYGPEDIEEFFR